MDNEMIDLTAGDMLLRGRLVAYMEARLTPDLTTSSRVRARVLAVAHRQANLARADAALMIVPANATKAGPGTARSHRPAWRGTVAALLAASLMIGVAAGTALAAGPGGPLYETRLWIEMMTLPTDPSTRAIAELQRLDTRLLEADSAARSGDLAATESALAAYGRIMDEASAAAIEAHDEIAIAVLETGVGRNLDVLRSLVQRVPTQASEAIDRVIERSGETIETIEVSKPNRSGGGTGGGGTSPGAGPVKPTPKATKSPTTRPTPAPATEPTDKPPKPDPTPRRTPTHGGD